MSTDDGTRRLFSWSSGTVRIVRVHFKLTSGHIAIKCSDLFRGCFIGFLKIIIFLTALARAPGGW